MRPAILSLMSVLAIVVSANAEQGVRPLAGPHDYPSSAQAAGVHLGAKLLSAKEVRKVFVSDLNRGGYLVVETAVYPKDAKPVAIHPGDFVLVEKSSGKTVRPAGAKAIAALLQKENAKDRDITLYPQAGVGYESGPGYYDPVTGTRRGGGMHTSVGLGVGIGNSNTADTAADRKTMETELREKGLPDETTSQPIAGYLYFPLKLKKNAKAPLELEYLQPGTSRAIKVTLK